MLGCENLNQSTLEHLLAMGSCLHEEYLTVGCGGVMHQKAVHQTGEPVVVSERFGWTWTLCYASEIVCRNDDEESEESKSGAVGSGNVSGCSGVI